MKNFFENLIDEFSSKTDGLFIKNIENLKKLEFYDFFEISFNSRNVKLGDIFVAITTDNVFFNIFDAIKNGARVIISEFSEKEIKEEISNFLSETKKNYKNEKLENTLKDREIFRNETEIFSVVFLETNSSRKALAKISSLFYGEKSKNILAVTGTNGKTSVVSIVREIFLLISENAASLGTLGVEAFFFEYNKELIKNLENNNLENNKIKTYEKTKIEIPAPKLTTYDSVSMNKILNELKKNQIENVAIELTSHGLHQYRAYGINFSAVCITNITQDHLDYHKSMDNYVNAKKMIFSSEYSIPHRTFAVINSKISNIDSLVNECKKNNLPIIFYGDDSSEIKIKNIKKEIDHTKFDLIIFDYFFENIELNLIGEFQLENLMAAIGLIIAGIKFQNKYSLDFFNDFKNEKEYIEKIVKIIPKIKPIPGRMQLVCEKNGAYIFIDFAHTPDALQKVLAELKERTKNKLIVVFGCGGERDNSKRKLMGEIASKYADKIILTDDNPRNENPDFIISQIMDGVKEAEIIHNRSEAIRKSVALLEKGDILIIAGKGHENTQIISGIFYDFSDEVEILKVCNGNF